MQGQTRTDRAAQDRQTPATACASLTFEEVEAVAERGAGAGVDAGGEPGPAGVQGLGLAGVAAGWHHPEVAALEDVQVVVHICWAKGAVRARSTVPKSQIWPQPSAHRILHCLSSLPPPPALWCFGDAHTGLRIIQTLLSHLRGLSVWGEVTGVVWGFGIGLTDTHQQSRRRRRSGSNRCWRPAAAGPRRTGPRSSPGSE